MSTLASKLADTPALAGGVRRGPPNACYPLYGTGDLEDFEALEALRAQPGWTWREVQQRIDQIVGVDRPLPLEKFRYHWRRRCFCWPEDLRR